MADTITEILGSNIQDLPLERLGSLLTATAPDGLDKIRDAIMAEFRRRDALAAAVGGE